MVAAPTVVELVYKPQAAPKSERTLRLGYRPCLDGLRAFAVFAVMAHHAYLRSFTGGQIGVDVFFVLSGFLITTILLEEWEGASRIDLKNFYRRRVLRLIPALLGLLLACEAVAIVRLRGQYFWTVQKAILAALCYAANWMRVSQIDSMGPLAHTWSLSIEEQFYILWPVTLMILLPRLRRTRIIALLLLIIAAAAIHRAALWQGESSFDRIYNGTDTRFDELLVGGATALMLAAGWLHQRFWTSTLRWAALPAAAFVGAQAAYPLSEYAMSRYGWPLIEVSVAVLLCCLLRTERHIFHYVLEFPPLVWVGRISYGLYLWHPPIFSKIGGWHLPTVVQVCLMFLVTFAVAGFSYYVIETPFLKLKSRTRPPALLVGS